MPAELLANVIRGNTTESVHYGHIVAVDGDGRRVISIGDPDVVTYFRSACKAFQLLPCITSGAADAFGFTEEELALGEASHSGEPVHVEIAERMLKKAGFTETDLRCGVHLPFNQAAAEEIIRRGEKPTQLQNNCSGKHAAMLAFAKHIGSNTADYEAADNRIQKRILRCVAEFTELPEDEIAIGTDGCSAPNFAVSLEAMARSYANLVRPVKFHESIQQAAARAVSAMLKYPHLIGGTERLDTLVMQASRGRLISKVGADGVWCCGILPSEHYPTGLGVALKIADGDDYISRPVVAVHILRGLGLLASDDLSELSPMPIRNRRGETVGYVVATDVMKKC